VVKVIECVQAHYKVEDVEFGKVYKWSPECVVAECNCGKRLYLTASTSSCDECGTDHVAAIQEELTDRWQRDEVLHPKSLKKLF
jgi:hypothetical protein